MHRNCLTTEQVISIEQRETVTYSEIVSARRNWSVQRNCIRKEKLFQKRVTASLQRNCFSDRENVFQLKETFSAHTKNLSEVSALRNCCFNTEKS